MASGDMIAKLLLDTKDFSNKIGKATKDVEGFGKKGELTAGSLMKGFGKVAAAVGAAVASYATFNKAIESSQALTDAWGRSMQSVNTVFDNFVYGLANADFSSFSAGMDSMIQKAREMYDAYDQLANTLMSARFSTALDQAAYREAMVKARNKSLPEEERRAALDEARAIAKGMGETARKVEADSYTALQSLFAAKTGSDASIFTPEMMERAFRIDARATSAEDRAKIEQNYAEYQRKMREAQGLYGYQVESYGMYGSSTGRYVGDKAARDKAISDLNSQFAETLVQYTALLRLQDEELQQAMNTYVNAVQQRNVSSEMNTSINELSTTIGNEVKATAKAVAQAGAKARVDAQAVAAAQAAVYDRPQAYNVPGMMGISYDNSHFWGGAFVGRGAATRYKSAVTDTYKRADPLALPGNVPQLQDSSFIAQAAEATAQVAKEAPNYAEGVGMVSESLGLLEAVCSGLSSTADNTAMKMLKVGTALVSAIAMITTATSPLGVIGALGGLASSVLPMFAEGGVVTRPTVGLVGEAGSEAIIPLNRLNEFIGGREVRVTGRLIGSGKDLTAVIGNYERVRSVKNV